MCVFCSGNVCLLKELQTPTKNTKESRPNLKESRPNLKESRLIVRNLSFKCKPDELRKAFTTFGSVTDAVIPLKADGKMFGYGFVQFTTVDEATEALEEMNGKQILGRPVAVDWAVAKSKYQQAVHKDLPEDSESSDDEMPTPTKALKSKKKAAQKDESKVSSGDLEEDEEDMDVDQHSDSEGSENVIESESEMGSERGSDSSDGEIEGENDLNSASDLETSKKKKSKQEKNNHEKSDTEDGKTVFIRNLAFECKEEGLEEKFAEFGDVIFARIVMDPNTGHSRSSAFVKFKSSASAQKCVDSAADESPSGGISLDGRRLNVTLAISRERATKLQEKKAQAKKEDNKDGRNLWLAREGLIRPGTQAAVGLSKVDLDKRAKVEQIKREKLKNPTVFISTTRLCVRNIPTKVDDAQLKTIYLKAAGDKAASIAECRIMRDLGNMNANAKAKGRGYAFVNFKEHMHALAALRSTNNNPDVFSGETKRLIVEFSLENKAALNAKKKRLERNKAKSEMLQKGKADYVTRPKQKKNKEKSLVHPQLEDEDNEESNLAKKKNIKGLPSHWGPKIRHKPRPAPPKKKTEKMFRKEKRKLENVSVEEPPAKKSRNRNKKRVAASDDFDKLVSKYTQKLSSRQPIKKSKWFND